MTSPTTPVEGFRLRDSRKLLAGLAVLLGLVMVLLVIFSHRGLYQIYSFRHERLLLEQENARLAEENARLARTIDRLQQDPEMIQELIRRELNFVKKNEIIFQLPPGSQKKSPAPPSPPSVAPDEPPAKAAPQEAGKKGWAWEFLEGAPKRHSNVAQ
jgi:cell division protein FtsB